MRIHSSASKELSVSNHSCLGDAKLAQRGTQDYEFRPARQNLMFGDPKLSSQRRPGRCMEARTLSLSSSSVPESRMSLMMASQSEAQVARALRASTLACARPRTNVSLEYYVVLVC